MAELRLRGAASIDAAALDALRRHRGPRTEPQLVAAIFRDEQFRRAIFDAVEARLWRVVAVRTVFVHGRPLVSFSCARGFCELGDALVVYRERLGVGQRRRQGVFFQAKMWRGNGRSWVEADPDLAAPPGPPLVDLGTRFRGVLGDDVGGLATFAGRLFNSGAVVHLRLSGIGSGSSVERVSARELRAARRGIAIGRSACRSVWHRSGICHLARSESKIDAVAS
jgi:hypothetical protein